MPGCFSAWAIKFSVSLNNCVHCCGRAALFSVIGAAVADNAIEPKSAVKITQIFFIVNPYKSFQILLG